MRTVLVVGIGILILALGFSLPAVARAQTLPDTPAGRQAAAFLEALRSIDEDARRGFVEQRLAPTFRDQFPMEVHLEQLRILAGELAGARIVGVQMPNPTAIRVALEKARGERLRLAVEVEPEPPHRIMMLGIDDTGGEEPVIRFGNLEELNRALERLTQEDRFSGVVLASRGGEVVFHEAYGLADRERKLPARRDTRFNIGSLNKSFTGVAILRLAQEGRLSLDDPIGKYLQGFPPEVANRVTIRQLLQHRSGMGDYLTHPEFRRDPKRFRTVDDLLELIRPAPLAFEPGTRQRYSNSGYVVLGAVIEALTGRAYRDVMHEWIFEPAGMTRTGPGGQEADANTAIGYSRRLASSEGGLVSNEQVRGPGSPAGGG
ncbi:MAG TPA: serine hydrolase, partial [Longimicrobiaceae bacterium]|nr:serine hydrolase [Longimicrobiaceae bacterium]